jgi:fused signal recognition particle receptor
MQQWAGLIVVGVFVLFFLLVGVAVLRKARRRRLEELRETREEELSARAEEAQLREGEAAAKAEREEEPTPRLPEVPSEPLEPAVPAAVPPGVEPGEPIVGEVPPKVDEALKAGLAKTKASFFGRLSEIFSRGPQVDPKTLDSLEEALLLADVGVQLSSRLVTELRGELKERRLTNAEEVQKALREQMLTALKQANGAGHDPLALHGDRPRVILFVGVNGVGKTTTIGKISQLLRERGLKVLLAAGDTFRAAAAEQLGIWAERTGCQIVRGAEGADPASVVFGAIEEGKKVGADVVLADTAGRLHTKTSLMDEIKKVKRSIGKARAGAPDEVWLVVDATTGQNALQQAREFNTALGLTGIILTKLDGTAKGGVVVAIADALKLPVRFVGVGEKAADLRPFDAHSFLAGLF